jgi:hypothetical protein
MSPSSRNGQAVALTRRVFLCRATVGTIATAVGGILGSRVPALAAATPDDIFEIQGEFLLDPASDGIDPATQPVALRLLVPPGDRAYPEGTDFMPVIDFVPTVEGWSISRAEKRRTGLDAFTILRTSQPGRFTFHLLDRRTALADRSYDVVWVELTIGDDAGEAHEALVERNGTWSLS